MVNRCNKHNCNKKIGMLETFNCKYCRLNHCPKHRIPENHSCEYVNNKNIFHNLRKKSFATEFTNKTLNYNEREKIRISNLRKIKNKPYRAKKRKNNVVYDTNNLSDGDGFFGIIVLIGIIIFVSLTFYPDATSTLYSDSKDFLSFKSQEELAIKKAAENVDLAYFSKSPIEYSIENCDQKKSNKIYNAISKIERSSNNFVKFKRVSYNPEGGIHIICYNYPDPSPVGAAGYGGPIYKPYYGFGIPEFREIDAGTVELYELPKLTGGYYYPYCRHPDTEMHEILHAMGFDHVNFGILHPSGDCTDIEKELGKCLEYIYSGGKSSLDRYCNKYKMLI